MKRFFVGLLALMLLTSCSVSSISNMSQNLADAAQEQVKNMLAVRLTRMMSSTVRGLADSLSRPGGYLDNPLVRILLPPPLRITLDIIREVKTHQEVSPLEVLMNHAAESAILRAAPILEAALQQVTPREALALLDGGETAVTDYLMTKTTQKLEEVLTPAIALKLTQNKAQEQYRELLARTALRLPEATEAPLELERDLATYVAQRSVVGVFKLLSEKEREIRSSLENYNPVVR